jgi:putative transposase
LAVVAASSLDKPDAIAAQNLLSSLRPATGGRPGERNGALAERSDRRFHLVIVAPHEALRRPLESTQYLSEQFQRLMADHGIVCSMSRAGNVWDNAAMESFFSSLKTERTARKTYRTRDQAKAEVFDYIESFYNPASQHPSVYVVEENRLGCSG